MPDVNIGQSELDYLNNTFLVTIPGVGRVGQFETCSEISAEIAVVKKRTGGSRLAKKIPSNIDVMPITLQQGAIHGDGELYKLFQRTGNLTNLRAILPSNEIYIPEIGIIQTDRNANPLQRHRLFDVWVSSFKIGGWDAKGDELTMVEVVFEVYNFEPDTDVSSINLVSELGG